MCKRRKVDANKASHLAFLERGAAWYPSLYAPRAGGAYDSHHRTAGIACRTRRSGCRVADSGAGAATRKDGLGEEPCARSVLFCSVSQ